MESIVLVYNNLRIKQCIMCRKYTALPSLAAVCVLAGWGTPHQNENDSVDTALGHTQTSVSISRESKWKVKEEKVV